MSQTELIQALVALGIGFLIGFERRLRTSDVCSCPTTYVYLSGGAWLFTLVCRLSGHGTGVYWPLAAALYSVIGLIALAFVMRRGTEIHGVTTAVMMTLAAVAGTGCGLGYPAKTAEGMGLILLVGMLTSLLANEHETPPADEPSQPADNQP